MKFFVGVFGLTLESREMSSSYLAQFVVQEGNGGDIFDVLACMSSNIGVWSEDSSSVRFSRKYWSPPILRIAMSRMSGR